MKKVLFGLLIVSLVSCHSTTETDVQAADSTVVVKAVDSVKVINDSLKVVDTLKK